MSVYTKFLSDASRLFSNFVVTKFCFSFIDVVRPVASELVLYIGNLPTQFASN